MVASNNIDELFNSLQSTEPYIDDEGFTSGVMARLPEAKQLPTWIANLIMLGFTTLGSALVAWQLPIAQWIGAIKTSTLQIPVAAIEMPAFSPLYALGAAALMTFLASYVVIWLAQNDAI